MENQLQFFSKNVLAAIADLAGQEAAMFLVQPFKGIILIQSLRILSVESDELIVQAPEHHLCLVMGSSVYLHHPALPQTISGHLKSLDTITGRLTLDHLAYTGTPWHERRSVRVEPKTPLMVNVRTDDGMHRDCIENISQDGMGLLAYKVIEKGIPLQTLQHVMVEFDLPEQQEHFLLHAHITNLNQISDALVRIGLQFQINAALRQSIADYVERRRREIQVDLEKLVYEINNPTHSIYQYF